MGDTSVVAYDSVQALEQELERIGPSALPRSSASR